jgi:potassium-transporting ATPase KdpC subunit
MFRQLLITLRLTIVLAIVTGIILPLILAGVARVILPEQAAGSLLRQADGRIVGSRLIGQTFTRAEYFHSRPSAAGAGYAAEASSGTNLGPTSAKLIEGTKDFSSVKQLAEQYRKENGLDAKSVVPVDAVTRSGSGLDPDISPDNALLQVVRVAKARNLPEVSVTNLVKAHVEGRQLGFLGEPRVNVLLLNLELDKLKS